MELEAATRTILRPDEEVEIAAPESPESISRTRVRKMIKRELDSDDDAIAVDYEDEEEEGDDDDDIDYDDNSTDDDDDDDTVDVCERTTGSEGRPLMAVNISGVDSTVTMIATATTNNSGTTIPMPTTTEELSRMNDSVNDDDSKNAVTDDGSSNKHLRLQKGSVSLQRQQHRHRRRQEQHTPVSEAQLDKLSSLIKIIRIGNYKEFSELLERRAFKNLLNVFVDGQTALHYTLIYGRSLVWCKQLVLNGANPNLTNRAGWHPIHLAAFNGSRETMRFLIDCIAN